MGTRQEPIDIEIQSPLLPYTDLLLQGDPKRTLHIPQDVLVTLAGLIGLQKGTPRMASISPTGGLYVTESGGGLNDVSSVEFALAAGVGDSVDLGVVCNPIYMRAKDADFFVNVGDKPAGATHSIMRIDAGFQAIVPISGQTFSVANADTVAGTLALWGFFYNNHIQQQILSSQAM